MTNIKESLLFDPNLIKDIYSSDELLLIMKNIKENKLDIDYMLSGLQEEFKSKFQKLWENYKGNHENNFLGRMKSQSHNALWEMYIWNCLSEFNVLLPDREVKSGLYIPRSEGPDFMVNDGSYIECVAVRWGKNPNPPIGNGQIRTYPKKEIQLRITEAFDAKRIQYEKWNRKKWFDTNKPYVLAINTALERSLEELPNIIFGIGALAVEYIRDGINVSQGNIRLRKEENLKKNKHSKVSKNLFELEEYRFISAVIYSNTHVSHYPDIIGSDLKIIINPNARNPINADLASRFKEVTRNDLISKEIWIF